ncbi:hypothetical protein C8Q70DRAFT_1091271 [Cubamyces menziesii]|nr:hypothetical protein C8Q70DRAFT_1091271 [Cubamyces menziesii]
MAGPLLLCCTLVLATRHLSPVCTNRYLWSQAEFLHCICTPEEHVLVKERAQESGYALIQDFPDLEAALEALFALSSSVPMYGYPYCIPFDERAMTYNLKASVSYEADWISSAATTRDCSKVRARAAVAGVFALSRCQPMTDMIRSRAQQQK